MTKTRENQFAQPRIDAWALLGLRDPVDATDWSPIRLTQLLKARELALFLFGTQIIGVAMVLIIAGSAHTLPATLGWGAAVGVAAAWVLWRRLRPPVPEVARVRGGLTEGLVLGLLWSLPPVALATVGDPFAALALWVVLSLVLTASTTALAPLPLAVIAFVGTMGIASVLMLALSAAPALAAVAALFALLLLVGALARAHGIVAQRAHEIALAERDETVSLLLKDSEEDAADWLWEIDAQRRVVRASPRFAIAVGLDALTINQQPLLRLLAGPSWETGEFSGGLRQLAERLKQREPFRDLLVAVHVKGEPRWWEISASPRFDDHGQFVGFRGVGSDVTEARLSAEKINRMARYDALTGLPNRLLLIETIAAAIAEAGKWNTRCAMMMIDLDRFKAVNDTLGHPVGDKLLGRVAERLGQLMREDEMVGRLGGDEFAVVLREARDLSRIEALARDIIASLSRPYEIDEHLLHIGASIGVAIGPRDGKTAETLIRSADLALYRSKDAGGGTFTIYEPRLHSEAQERRTLEIALRKALENEELHLAYQPVVDAGTGRLVGFEALLRWVHPELGPVSPGKFIPLAEEARLIAPIGDWVLRAACHEAARWPNDVRVAVNVSPEQLYNPGFVGVVAQALAASGLPAHRLELEVTESVFMREGTGAVAVLESILDLGVKLSLDDFGTGYSSLGYLSRTRFSTIKVDRSFVQGASKGVKEAIAIIRAVVALAQSLGMATTAEGVETEAEHRLLHALGCTKVQGYYFGRPLPVEEARALAQGSAGGRAAA